MQGKIDNNVQQEGNAPDIQRLAFSYFQFFGIYFLYFSIQMIKDSNTS